jgi:drug/metabolite transporter (DMT)-like permease
MPPASRLAAIVALGVVATSLAAIFVRLADAPGVVVAAYRMLFAGLILLPWTLMALRRTPLTRQNLPFALFAGLMLAGHFATWISSLSYTTVAASVTLVSTGPIWMALFSWLFLRLAPSLSVITGVMIAVLGGALIGFASAGQDEGGMSLLGNGLALAGAIFMAAYLLLGRSAQRRGLTLQAYVGVAYAVAAIALLPLPWLFGHGYLAYSRETFFWILLLALIPQLVGHTSYNYAMRHLDPTLVATLTLLEPLGAGMLAFALFGEVPPALTLLGALLVLVGVGFTLRHSRLGADIAPPPREGS